MRSRRHNGAWESGERSQQRPSSQPGEMNVPLMLAICCQYPVSSLFAKFQEGTCATRQNPVCFKGKTKVYYPCQQEFAQAWGSEPAVVGEGASAVHPSRMYKLAGPLQTKGGKYAVLPLD